MPGDICQQPIVILENYTNPEHQKGFSTTAFNAVHDFTRCLFFFFLNHPFFCRCFSLAELWVKAASWEADEMNFEAARALMQRCVNFNKTSRLAWVEVLMCDRVCLYV